MTVQPSFGSAIDSMTEFFARLTANPPAPLPGPLANPAAAVQPDPQVKTAGVPEHDDGTGTEGLSASQPTLMSAWAGSSCSGRAAAPKPQSLNKRQQWQAAMSAKASQAASNRLGQLGNSLTCITTSPLMRPPPSRLSGSNGLSQQQSGLSGLPVSGAAVAAQSPVPVMMPPVFVPQHGHQMPQSHTLGYSNPVADAAAQAAASTSRIRQAMHSPAHFSNSQMQLPHQPHPDQDGQAGAGSAYGHPDSAMQPRAVYPQAALHPHAASGTAQPVQYASPPPTLSGQTNLPSSAVSSATHPNLGHAAMLQHHQQAKDARLEGKGGWSAHHQQPGLQNTHQALRDQHLRQHQQAEPVQQEQSSASGAPLAHILEWVSQDLADFTTWVSNHEVMQVSLITSMLSCVSQAAGAWRTACLKSAPMNHICCWMWLASTGQPAQEAF